MVVPTSRDFLTSTDHAYMFQDGPKCLNHDSRDDSYNELQKWFDLHYLTQVS